MKAKILPTQNSKGSCTGHTGKAPRVHKFKGVHYLFLLLAAIMLHFSAISQTITVDGNPGDWPAVLMNQPIATFVVDFPQSADNQFTQGTKDYDNAAEMTWSISPVGDKVNLVNGGATIIDGWLYFFGDRTSSNGSAQIGFWVFQNGTSPGPGTGFSPNKTPGDLLVLSEFTNGGGVATIKVYRWLGTGTGPDRLEEVPVNQAQAMAMVSANSTGYPVPNYPGWEYCNKENKDCGTYYPGSFFEGAVDLDGLLTPEQLCKATFLLETRQSFTLNAMLGDFIAGSFNISPDPPSVLAVHSCKLGELVTLSVENPVLSETYKWYSDAGLTNLVFTGPSYSFNITQNSTFWVTASEGSCEGLPSQVTATVTELSCSIINYTPPVFGQSAGSATVEVLVNGQPSDLPYTIHWSHGGSSATVNNIPNTGSIVTITLGNCTTTCEIPATQGCPDLSYELGCNPVLPNEARVKADLEAHYGQGSVITFSQGGFSAGTIVENGCLRSQGFTVSYQDQYGNVESGCTVNYTWKEDTTAPEVIADGDGGDLGCNPTAEEIEAALGSATANDLCDGDVDVTYEDSDISEDGCYRSITRTFTAEDECGNEGTATVTVTYKVDTDGPVLVGELTNLVFACDADVVLPNPQFTDNCDGDITVTYTVGGVASGDLDELFEFPEGDTEVCYTAVDACGNPTEVCITITVAPCEVICETAYGKGNGAVCFIPTFDRWGWTNAITPGNYTYELWAAAGQCDTDKGTLVGSVDVVYGLDGHVSVTYNVEAPYYIEETHTYVGTTMYPQVKRGRGTVSTVAPGSYYNAGPFDGGQVYVIAHAVVCGPFETTAPVIEASTIEKSAVIERLDNATELKVYPNPFSTRVAFEFVSGKDVNARLEIYNNVGQMITTLMDRPVEKGVLNRVEFTPSNITHGVLFYRLLLDDEVQNGKLLYSK
jgi:hypothetical protein